MLAREEEAQSLHKEMRDKGCIVSKVKEEGERVQQIHQEQCKDYQKQIDIVNILLVQKFLHGFCYKMNFLFLNYEQVLNHMMSRKRLSKLHDFVVLNM